MEGICSRCGRKGPVEYGADGLPYCSSCLFYGNNRPCWRCRMYLPISELQKYKGQWYCPYCIQELRAQDRKNHTSSQKYRYAKQLTYVEKCDRCGRDLDTVYVLNGRRLCKSCFEEEKSKWDIVSRKPPHTLYKMKVNKKDTSKGLISAFFDFILSFFGVKRKQISEVVIVNTKKIAPLPEFGRPLVTDKLEVMRQQKKIIAPETESIIKNINCENVCSTKKTKTIVAKKIKKTARKKKK